MKGFKMVRQIIRENFGKLVESGSDKLGTVSFIDRDRDEEYNFKVENLDKYVNSTMVTRVELTSDVFSDIVIEFNQNGYLKAVKGKKEDFIEAVCWLMMGLADNLDIKMQRRP